MSEGISGGTMAGGGTGMVSIPAYILEDSPRLAKKLEALKEAEAAAREAYSLLGTAEEIGTLRAQAAAERDAQDELTAKTKKDCEALVANAQSEAASMVDHARETAEGLLLETEKQVAAAKEETAIADRATIDAKLAIEQLNLKETEQRAERGALNKLQVELHNLQDQLLKEQSTLATVREQIVTILG